MEDDWVWFTQLQTSQRLHSHKCLDSRHGLYSCRSSTLLSLPSLSLSYYPCLITIFPQPPYCLHQFQDVEAAPIVNGEVSVLSEPLADSRMVSDDSQIEITLYAFTARPIHPERCYVWKTHPIM